MRRSNHLKNIPEGVFWILIELSSKAGCQRLIRVISPGVDFERLHQELALPLSAHVQHWLNARDMECSGESPVGKVRSQSVSVRTYIPLSNVINSTSSYSLSYSYSNVVTKGITLNYTINEVMLTEQNTPSLLLDAKFDENSASKSGYVSLSPVNRNLASDMLHISRQDTGEQIPLDNTEVRFEDAIKLDVSTKATGKHDIPLLVTLGLD
ncbi:hypothetical protein [Escherichia coli]|uniref:hypothetical protein n=1 Tax=Escherichia coli TaxID=562 RepID=UPI0002A20A79|nr:hypothetical protein [Escherichia coli]ELF96793.1 hypothetical protein A1S5_04024 [Escherichia coli KTE48]